MTRNIVKAIGLMLALASTAGADPCEPYGTWHLELVPRARAEGAPPACTGLPKLTGATLVIAPGRGTWNGVKLEKLVVFNDAGTWDVTAFPRSDDPELSVVLRIREGKLVEDGGIVRQPKPGHAHPEGCIDTFDVHGTCKR